MNERLRELVKQHGVNITIDGLGYGEGNIEKFAELIVGECMSVAQEYDGAKLSGPGLIIAMRIEQHFGVEEK